MSDEVGVEPDRLNELASKLEHLRDVLAANVPVIVNTLNLYWAGGQGYQVNLAPLSQAQARSAADAGDTRARFNMAIAWERMPTPCLADGKIAMPWFTGDQLSAASDAELLTQAEAESAKDPKAARAQIQAIEADIQHHVNANDTAWLVDFYNQASPQVAMLAATLNREDGQNGVVLTRHDEQILNAFATGLAHADKNGTLSSAAIDAYANAKNLWSVGMLFKFGPPGSAYGTQESGSPPAPNLLAKATIAIELARLNGGFTIPLTSSQLSNDWGSVSLARLQEFDPSQAMLALATQNGVAAREVLGDQAPIPKSLSKPNQQEIPTVGQEIANGLMIAPTTWYPPSFSDGGTGTLRGFSPTASVSPWLASMAHPPQADIAPSVIADLFRTAISAPRGTGNAAQDSAAAAMNIIDGTPPPSTVAVPEPVRQALLNTAQRYLFDLGQSCENQSSASLIQPLHNDQGNPWSVNVAGPGTDTPLANFLQQIASNPKDDGLLMASAKTAFSQYFGLQQAGKLPPELGDAPYTMAELIAQIETQSNSAGIKDQQATDAQQAQYNALLAFAESQASKIPVIGAPIGATQTAAGLLGFNMPQFSTNNADAAYGKDQQSFAIQQMAISVPMVQGMIDYGLIPTSMLEGQSWYQNGHIVLRSQTDVARFDSWFQNPLFTAVREQQLTAYQNVMRVQHDSSGLNPLAGQ